MNRADCERLDARDPLRHLRERFVVPEGLIYLDGNSLGMLPRNVAGRLAEVVEKQWGEDLIRSWNLHGWVDLPHRVGDRIARLIGAEPGSVLACDSTSVNLFKLASASVRMARSPVVLTDSGNFPSDRYVLSSVAEVRVVEPERVVESLSEEIGVVALTQVDYRTGRRHDMAAVTAAARAAGVLTIWDLAHSAGAFEVRLEDCGADLAVGCGYKYLNGGPGAPAFLYVAPRHMEAFENPIPGWFGHADPFEFSSEFRPATGIGRARIGTPHVLSLAALDAALDLFDDVDLAAIRVKSESLTGLMIDLVDVHVPEVEVLTPRDPDRRGSQVNLRHPDGYPIVQSLIADGVVGDFRAPDVLRFGMAPMYTSHVDVFDAVMALRSTLADGRWRRPGFSTRRAVT
ncbi:MAG TPA: kynureninase [Acidimicrobiia bacterium]